MDKKLTCFVVIMQVVQKIQMKQKMSSFHYNVRCTLQNCVKVIIIIPVHGILYLIYLHRIVLLLPFPADRPELYQLQHIQGQGGVVVKIIEKVAAHWERLALALHFEGHVLEIVRRDHVSDSMAQCRAILYRWLNGEARSPVSWNTLVTSLKEIEFTLLAEGLEAVLRK